MSRMQVPEGQVEGVRKSATHISLSRILPARLANPLEVVDDLFSIL